MNQVYSGTFSVEEVHRHYVEVIDLFNDEQFHEFKSCQPIVVQMSSINTATTAKEKGVKDEAITQARQDTHAQHYRTSTRRLEMITKSKDTELPRANTSADTDREAKEGARSSTPSRYAQLIQKHVPRYLNNISPTMVQTPLRKQCRCMLILELDSQQHKTLDHTRPHQRKARRLCSKLHFRKIVQNFKTSRYKQIWLEHIRIISYRIEKGKIFYFEKILMHKSRQNLASSIP